jgi:hypothetical protein
MHRAADAYYQRNLTVVGQEIIAILRAASKRGLPSLLIGANAVIMLGYIRNTVDLDLLVPEHSRSQWLDLLRELGYRFFHGIAAFAQFEPPEPTGAPVDLMFVDQSTWQKMIEGAKEMRLAGERVLLPRPEYLVALKLHAAASPTRSKPEVDWEDIRQIVGICALDPEEESFRELIYVMVEKMASPKSETSPGTDGRLSADIDLPVFEEPLIEHWPSKMSWDDAVQNFAPYREHYMRNFDSPEKRLREKNREPFRLA